MFNSIEGYDGDSIVEAITQYAEKATSSEFKIIEMKSELYQLKLYIQKPHAAYFAPQQQAFQSPPTKIQIPN